ncbi:MAG: asparagine synthase (glutamine-hydrolyzing) [Flavobacterium sp.]|uniref:asparagine synthase (glutamine-hydrolyzing) n=1 Tax=Flavobacterium sp. TaxID=239 RepID=UPI003265E040
MCGFLFEYKPNNLSTKQEFINLLSESKLRGPDHQGYWSNNNSVQMGFNRLAILDLTDAGIQPMISPSQKFVVVFNGEIYNHLELRQKLHFKKFRGQSDTETITACLDEFGVHKTIESLDGMFAISIYNQETKEIFLARDFAGIKPLFYGWNGKTLVVASQYDQIRNHSDFKNNSIDEQVLKLYLQQHFVPAPFGLYKETFQVKPGEIITFDSAGNCSKRQYWEFPSKYNYTITNTKEAEQLVYDTLDSCVKDQMIADVPLGAFLSGGVDSPLICSFAKKYKKDLSVFSIGSDSAIHDESDRATAYANALELPQDLWKLSAKEVVKYWNEATKSLHEPLADFSILPTYLVSKLAKKKVTVALSGDGGDELFFGYERFWSIGKNTKYQHLPEIIRKGIYGLDKYYSGNKNVNSVLLSQKQAIAHESLHSRFRKPNLHSIAPNLKNIDLPELWNVYDYENCKDERDLIMNMQKAEFYGMMQKTLRKVDLASMENSLEVRVPFLQKKMIETSWQIDPFLSYGKGNRKELLKNILQNQIPQVPREEVKKGFTIPLRKWIQEDLKHEFEEKLLEGNTQLFGFEKKAIEKMLQEHFQNKNDHKWALFTMYALLK